MGKGLHRGRNGVGVLGRPNPSRFRLLAWALLVATVFGVTGLGQPLEDLLRTGRNLIRKHDASGEIVVVAIDDNSLAKFQRWPWPRRYHAAITDELARLGARRIVFDIDFSSTSDPTEDRLLAEAFARHPGKVVLPVQNPINPSTGNRTEMLPLPMFDRHVEKGTINFNYDYRGVVWSLPYALTTAGRSYPSFGAKLGGRKGEVGDTFPIDYSIDYRSIPAISAVDLIENRVTRDAIAGKDVIIGATAHQLKDNFFAPGIGLVGGVFIHVLGAETLKAGAPLQFGWMLPLLGALALGSMALLMKSARLTVACLASGIVVALVAPIALDSLKIYTDAVPALMLLTMVGARLGWLGFRQTYSAKAITHPLSGLPNLNALRSEDVGSNRPLIAARITNFAEITSSLPTEMEKNLIDQIAARLTVGSIGKRLYQGDEGVFAWFADDEMAVTLQDHLNALHTLFRSPVVVEGAQLDLVVTFGVELGSGRSIANRLGSALVVADEAAAEGLKWKEYDAARLKEAPWRLSLLSQLDSAIDAGDLWIAYQPKLDLKTRRTIGAEALVRWTHPEKGPISPAEFVLAAEQSGRIQKLTNYVLERAVKAAAEVSAHGIQFGIAVNLSARLIDDTQLPDKIFAVLRTHGLGPEQLTLEITETAALGTTSAHLENLARLRALGVQISIDDYGTGLSTLDYLKKIPANEIKIDRSFVQAMHRNQGDRVIVDSTIQLAHSLGRRVVAEGVEDREALYTLSLMGCDVAQGFFIGRPMPLGSLLRQLLEEQGERLAAQG
jgi:EAL domain-containing protein (putative c-di-GMP-specific phosphodiesterase class I)/CHASE2 domain-containing sensor protein